MMVSTAIGGRSFPELNDAKGQVLAVPVRHLQEGGHVLLKF